MPEYTTPGVYVEELPATGPITGVGTSTAAFLGVAGRGPEATPTKVTNLTQFTDRFVPASSSPPYDGLIRGVRGFFENGGTVAYVTRVASPAVAASVELQGGEPARTVLTITAKDVGEAGNTITIDVPASDGARFSLVLGTAGGKDGQTFGDLSLDPTDRRFVGALLAGTPVDATVAADAAGPPSRLDDPVPLTGGTDDDAGQTGSDADWKAALAALARVDDVNLVCAPGITRTSVQQALIAHCEQTGDRFAILDGVRAADPAAILQQRGNVESSRGYAALYHPWLQIPDPDGRPGDTVLVPPSGHVAGIFSRVDAQRGVHKAPANELVTGVLGVADALDDAEHGELNEVGVNVLRVFPGRARPAVWGARTTAPPENAAWRYINVRRLFLFVEESIQEGIRWAVFEPNDLSLWKRLDRTITEFLTRVWSSGALFGATAAEAFYVKIDEENNPEDVRELGQVVVEVGVAPVRPAEFVVVRIGMWTGGAQAQEG
jgi:phage tail sheath protein FI